MKITVEFDVDLDTLNIYLGNTPNVTLESSINEFISTFSPKTFEHQGYDEWSYEPTGINSFRIIK